jgi:hypothetical protein
MWYKVLVVTVWSNSTVVTMRWKMRQT